MLRVFDKNPKEDIYWFLSNTLGGKTRPVLSNGIH